MTIRTTVAAAGLLFAANLFGASATDSTWIRGVTDKDPITYKAGEEMSFTLTVERLDGELKNGEFSLDWKRSGDDGIVETGKVSYAGAPFVYKTRIDFPGFVRLEAKLVDAKGKQASKNAFFDGGAGADIDALEGHPEPKDFDEFWGRQFARLDKIKINPELVEVESPTNAVKCYAVSVPCAGLRPVTGYLSVPVDVEKGVTFPVKVMFHGYSGDIGQVQLDPDGNVAPDRNHVQFFLPEEGFSLSCDEMVIPKTAPNKDLAYKFIDFIHQPDVAAQNMQYTVYWCPNAPAKEILREEAPDMVANETIFPAPETLKRGEVIDDLGENLALYTKVWDEVLAAGK